MPQPEYPIQVLFKEDGESWILNDEDELANNLEWFDSEGADENAAVTDKNGRAVRLKVEKLELIIFELK